jgi:hypothetical protein
MKEPRHITHASGHVAAHGRWYAALRLLCALVCVIVIALDAISLPAAYTLLQSPCAPCAPNGIQFTVDQINAVKAAGISVQAFALYTVILIAVTQFTFSGLGALLFIRRSDDGMALITSLTLVTFGGAAFTGTLQALPSINTLFAAPVYTLNVIGQVSFFVFLYLFPNGRWVPRWTVIPAVIWLLVWVLPAMPSSSPMVQAFAAMATTEPVFIALILSVVAAQIYRYWRVSSLHERHQTKWVVFGIGLGLVGFLTVIILGNILLPSQVTNNPILTLGVNTLDYAFFLLIPISIAIAVLRSRLYDVDALINGTLVYGSLTVTLATLYFGLIAGAQTLLRHINAQAGQSQLVIILSTLLIAALIQPLRRRIQAIIDQRFYRRKYDAAHTLQAFDATLRGEVELGDLSDHLVTVVQQTMQPTQVSLWLRPATEHGGEQGKSGEGEGEAG